MSDRDGDSDRSDELLRLLAHAPPASDLPAIAVGDLQLAAADVEPQTIGGFEIVRRLGSGGMGIVYEAIDPTLRRKVAVKLVRSRRAGRDGTARMLREAQALAKLSHPNVVTAYAAGIDGDQIYLIMELVAGVTARHWCTAQPRTVREIIEIYRQAARGLAVAHAAGLVHRDVKPENILVGEDGRVRITDFGLVGEVDSVPARGDGALQIEELTATGTVLGTLPYIAPEAHRGQPIGPAADQWSLCVALWESIAGERPHAATAQAELVTAVTTGALAKAPRIPARIRSVLARGLALDPDARWPSLDALFEALERANRGSRWTVMAVAGLGVVGAGVAIAAILRGDGEPAISPPSAPIARTVTARVLPTPAQTCPYMPSYVDNDTLVFGDDDGHVLAIPATGDVRTLRFELDPYRVARGRRPGEAVFVSRAPAAFVDVATGEKPPCATGGMPFFDEHDRLHVVSRPWTEKIHRVEL